MSDAYDHDELVGVLIGAEEVDSGDQSCREVLAAQACHVLLPEFFQ